MLKTDKKFQKVYISPFSEYILLTAVIADREGNKTHDIPSNRVGTAVGEGFSSIDAAIDEVNGLGRLRVPKDEDPVLEFIEPIVRRVGNEVFIRLVFSRPGEQPYDTRDYSRTYDPTCPNVIPDKLRALLVALPYTENTGNGAEHCDCVIGHRILQQTLQHFGFTELRDGEMMFPEVSHEQPQSFPAVYGVHD